MLFKDMFIENTGVNPFQYACTIASACQIVYKSSFLKPNTIGVIPSMGYQPQKNYSAKSIRWLMWKQHVTGQQIRHAKNGGEVRVGQYWCDGMTIIIIIIIIIKV